MIFAFLDEAARVLLANRTRSLLTITGLVIGVAAVIAIQIMGRGMAGAIGGVLKSLDNESFIVQPNGRQRDFTRAALKLSDIARAQNIGNVKQVVPFDISARQIRSGHHKARLLIVSESEHPFFSTPVAVGRALSAEDVATSAKVCVISERAYQRLFDSKGDVLGSSIRVGEARFDIVGVQGPSKTGIIPISINGDIAIPYTTYTSLFLRGRPVFAARFVVDDQSKFTQTEAAALKYFRDIKKGRADYQTFDRKSFSAGIDGIFATLTVFVGLIGAVSLVVAGIGILNIMLVSVAERTREIGLRKAIGATRFAILLQFFIEALLLSAIGCGIGLVIGVLIGWAVNRFAIIALTGIVAPIPWLQAIGIAVGFATLVTVVFGTYPAYRAARLDPIEALRYE